MNQIILFDLGDTLVYRPKKHLDSDVELIAAEYRLNPDKIRKSIIQNTRFYPGVYSPWLDNRKIRNLSQEKNYYSRYFSLVFASLGISQLPEDLIEKRLGQKRYFLFPNSLFYLQQLCKLGYQLGIFTNGRPSRRIVLQELHIDQFFNPKMIFISDELQLTKNDPAAYRLINLQLPSDKITLCDDEQQFLDLAAETGWTGLLVNQHKLGLSVLDPLVKM